jgi:hypothetical protein
MGIPPGITSSGTRNPHKEWDSAGNNQLMEADSGQQDQNMRNNPQSGHNFRISK